MNWAGEKINSLSTVAFAPTESKLLHRVFGWKIRTEVMSHKVSLCCSSQIIDMFSLRFVPLSICRCLPSLPEPDYLSDVSFDNGSFNIEWEPRTYRITVDEFL
jgi:hypothetical protein